MAGVLGVFGVDDASRGANLIACMAKRMQHRHDDVIVTRHWPKLALHAAAISHPASQAEHFAAWRGERGEALVWAGEAFLDDTHGPAAPRSVSDALRRSLQSDDASDFGPLPLSGMFAGLWVDADASHAALLNDRFGSERLYVHEHEGCVYFASEAKALLEVLPALRAFDEQGVADFLTFGSVLGGRTLFKGLRHLPGGSLWSLKPARAVRKARHFSTAHWEASAPLDEERFEKSLSDSLAAAMRAYASTDARHPLGISLTAGLDTRMIMACLPPDARSALTYTYAPQQGETLDVRIARRIAALCGLSHEPIRLPPSFLSDFARHVDRTVWISDGCAGLLGTHELPLSEMASELSPVRLTGNFGSEVLRSMSTFKPVGLDAALIEGSWVRSMAQAEARVRERTVHPVTHAAFQEVPWHLSGTLLVARSQLTVRTPYLDNAIVELAYRAPARLRESTHPSLRVVHEHRAELASVPTDRGLAWQAPRWKELSRRLYAEVTFKLDYWHKEGLPSSIAGAEPVLSAAGAFGLLGMHKFLPYRTWFRRELAPWLADVVAEVRRRRMPFWNDAFLAGVVDDHVSGRRNRIRELHAIVTLEAVDRLLMRAEIPTSASIQAPLGVTQ